ncbi:MAG: lysophospholipid acyltransferase family protein [bacterium]
MILNNKQQRLVGGFLCRWLAPPILLALYRSRELNVQNREPYDQVVGGNRPFILAFWHGQMLPLLNFFRNHGLYTFISPHRDGEYISRVLEGLGNCSIRTSLRDMRLSALKQAIRLVREGESLAITPDGPVGPAFQAKPGIIKVSKRLEIPILPVAGMAGHQKILESWDRFVFPLPLGATWMRFGEMVEPWKASKTEEEQTRELEYTLNTLTEKVSRQALGRPDQYLQNLEQTNRAREHNER